MKELKFWLRVGMRWLIVILIGAFILPYLELTFALTGAQLNELIFGIIIYQFISTLSKPAKQERRDGLDFLPLFGLDREVRDYPDNKTK
ncbi:MAG: hypothetical protein HC875_35360 [Anaerolineales bacterium]|nr:hypothetical protein [Anaerolineales bacterium]